MPTRPLPYIKPHIKRLGACLLALLLIGALLPAGLVSHPQKAQAAVQATTVSSLLGITRQDFVDYLNQHKNDYLGTAYKSDWPNPTTYQTGPWWSRGNHPYEQNEYNGVNGYGMNCSGFLARVWCDMGAENTTLLNRWKNAHAWMWANSETLRETLISLGATYYTFDSKEDLLASGKLQKGDLVQMDSDSGNDDHVGIFWGSTSSDDKFWHSIFDHNSTTTGKNVISEMYGKMTSGTYYLFKFDERGWFKLWKESADTSITAGNNTYSLAGATFGIYSTQADALADHNRISTLETKAHADYDEHLWGYAESPWLAPGSYYVKELTPAKGYALPQTNAIKCVTVNAGEEASASLTFADPPKAAPMHIALQKIDSATSSHTPQGDASLSDAQFTLSYYDGFYKTADEAYASGEPNRTWVIKTDQEGKASLNTNSLISGDKLYRDKNGFVVVPLGTLLIEETKAPLGYELPRDASPVVRTISDTTSMTETTLFYNAPTIADEVIRGGVRILKHDKESHETTPLGGATLDETIFEIALASNNPIYIDNIKYEPGDVVKTLTTKDGFAQTSSDCLPFATYTITEVAPSVGYKLTATDPRTFSIKEDGVIVEPFTTQNAFENQVKRGDLELIKVGEGSMERLGRVPFRLTSKTTGESHIVVTDENGKLSTHSDWNLHSQNTNANDSCSEDTYDLEAGVWFGLTQSGNMTQPIDSLGALPFDTYQLTELACSANAGYQLVDIDNIVIKKDKCLIDLGTVIDSVERTPEISTFAHGEFEEAGASKSIFSATDAVVLDEVSYENLDVGKTYLLKASLHVVETAEDGTTQTHPVTNALDEPLETSHIFIATASHATTQVSITFDATNYADQTLVVYEELYEDNTTSPLATHADPLDTDQQVIVKAPRIQTNARDIADQDTIISAETNVCLEDEVSFSGLTPNKTYEICGTLMIKETEEPLIDENGNPVCATQAFTPDQPDGMVLVTFSFDASMLAGQTLVVFESLLHNGQQIAVHADLEDINQTIEIREPSIVSYASDLLDGAKAIQLNTKATLVDVVHYDNLTPTALALAENEPDYPAYLAVGILIDKATEKPLALNPKDQDHVNSFFDKFQELVSDKTKATYSLLADLLEEYSPYAESIPIRMEFFDPDQTNGSREMHFELPDTLSENKDVVIYQYLYKMSDEGQGELVGVDADITNENQTVTLIAPPQNEPPTTPTPQAPKTPTPDNPDTPDQDSPKTPLAKTGDTLALGAVALLSIAGLAIAVLVLVRIKNHRTSASIFVLALTLGVATACGLPITNPDPAFADDVPIQIHKGSVFDAEAQGIILDSRRVFDISKAEFSTTNPAKLGIVSQRVDRDPVHQTYRGIAYLETPTKGIETLVSGSASLVWSNVGVDTQGDRVDVEITISDITIHNKTANDEVILLLTEVEGFGILEAQAITNTGLCGNAKTLSLNVYKTGTTTPASGHFLMGVRDLDLPDRVSDTTPNYQGKYCESIQLLQGYEPDIYINEACFLSIDESRALFQPTQEDLQSSFDSGFVVALNPTGSRFLWAGTACGTVVFDQFESHNIFARTQGCGSISDEGSTLVGWKNSKTYHITPDEYYEVADVVVDGESCGRLKQYTFTNITADHEIVAIFEPILISVEFTDGLNTLLSSTKIPQGSIPCDPTPPVRDGYLFESWDVPLEKLFADTTINALWRPIVYYVTFDSNGGVGDMPSQALSFDETASLDPCTFTKPQHTFEGWLDEQGELYEDEALVSNLASTDLAEVDLVAQWEEIPDNPAQVEQPQPQPENPQPESPRPEDAQPTTPQPETPQPESPELDAPQPEAPQPEAPQPETPQPEAPQPESPEADLPNPTQEQPQQDVHAEATTTTQEEQGEQTELLPQTADNIAIKKIALMLCAATSIALFAIIRLKHDRRSLNN